jgi:hypothetical protein
MTFARSLMDDPSPMIRHHLEPDLSYLTNLDRSKSDGVVDSISTINSIAGGRSDSAHRMKVPFVFSLRRDLSNAVTAVRLKESESRHRPRHVLLHLSTHLTIAKNLYRLCII